MGYSIEKQAIPVEFFDQIRTDEKFQALVDQLWGCGDGMFSWFTPPSVTRFGHSPSPIDEFKHDRQAMKDASNEPFAELHDPFESEEELEAYCALLEQRLEQLKSNDPSIVQRQVYFDRRIDEQIYSFLSKELALKFPTFDAEFAHTAIWGGQQFKPSSELRYLLPDEVSTIADVLNQIEIDASMSDRDDWLDECYETIQAFKTCFVETAERQQIILTKMI